MLIICFVSARLDFVGYSASVASVDFGLGGCRSLGIRFSFGSVGPIEWQPKGGGCRCFVGRTLLPSALGRRSAALLFPIHHQFQCELRRCSRPDHQSDLCTSIECS